VAAIVAAFMLGLGAGSLGGGALSTRLGPRTALYAFAAVEVAIGAFGALSATLYYDVLYAKASWLYSPLWRAVLVHQLALLPPTFLMGMSLPLLARGTVLDAHAAGRTLGLLYGINLLGAALGALLAPWVLIRSYGIEGATWVAAGANVFAGMAGVLAGLRARPASSPTPAPVPATPTSEGGGLRQWIALYALSGFCALSLEVVWFRLLDVAVKSSAFTFGTLLCVYLLGSALGCFAAASLADRVARPLPVFLALQCALVAYAAAAVLVLVALPVEAPLVRWYYGYWAGSVRFRFFEWSHWAGMLRLYGLLPAALFGLPTLLMGASFPLLQRAVQDDPATAGRKVGILQAANIAGCVTGSLLIGLVVLATFGTTGALRLILAAGLVFAVFGLRVGPRPLFAAAALVLVLLAVLVPEQGALWMRLHGRPAGAGQVSEDATGVAAVAAFPNGSHGVFVNGKHHSTIPFGGTHTRLGAAPAIVHPAPESVAIIGLGSGDTAWAAGCRPETRSVTVFEISGGQPGLLGAFAGAHGYPPLRSLLSDPRVHIVIEDGRRALDSGDALYDVIEADALWPTVAYSGNLYSREFFAMCARRLKPGGLLCTWAPTPRIYATFVSALPHVIGLGDREVLIGSREPLVVDVRTWKRRLQAPAVQAYLGPEGAASTEWMLERLQSLHRSGRRFRAQDQNADLFPRDEFAAR
jgi:predicted membrane-bound spermidine synthase